MGPDGATELSLKTGSSHDLILMLEDLSYDDIDNNSNYNIKNARKWATKANKIVGMLVLLVKLQLLILKNTQMLATQMQMER